MPKVTWLFIMALSFPTLPDLFCQSMAISGARVKKRKPHAREAVQQRGNLLNSLFDLHYTSRPVASRSTILRSFRMARSSIWRARSGEEPSVRANCLKGLGSTPSPKP